MCGICGIVSPGTPVALPTLHDMTDTMVHRGPDEEGHFVDNNVGLGHRRLSIIDRSSGQQPMHSADKDLVVVFNGEIYNYQGLRKELKEKGHSFATNSDTETILAAYQEYGQDCVEKFRGMFVFAVYRKSDKSLFIARDRLGIKPLYYSFENGTLVFGSEIKALLASNLVDKQLDYSALSDYFTYLYIPAPKSIFKNIRKLEAGHTLFFKDHKISIRQYWNLKFRPDTTKTEDEWVEELNAIIRESVDMRMISEVPLGAFLSGGIDSSLVVATMAGLSQTPVKTNSIGFNEAAFNELPYARETAALLGTAHAEQTVNVTDVSVLDTLAWLYDEPFADSSMLPTYFVSKMTRENVTVAQSGDGGDENFAGYRRYAFDAFENRVRDRIPSIVRRTVFGLFGALYPKGDYLPQVLRGKTLLTNLAKSPAEGYFTTMSHFLPPMKRQLFSSSTQKELAGYNPYSVFQRHYANADCDDLLSRIQYTDIKTYLVDDILTKVDRASMGVSLEVRVPLLDHVFMECAARIPSDLKLKGTAGKYILKKTAVSVLPSQIFDRKKAGFSIPLDDWFRGGLKDMFTQEVLAGDSRVYSFCERKTVESMWQRHLSRSSNYGTHLWALLMFEKWARKFL